MIHSIARSSIVVALALAACSEASSGGGSSTTPTPVPAPVETGAGGNQVGRRTVEGWEEQLTHQDPRMRLAAVRELDVLGAEASPLGPALLARIIDPGETGQIRTAAVKVVGQVCGDEAIPVLAPIFADGGPLAQNATGALVAIGAASDTTFVQGLENEKAEVRRLAATGLFRLFEQGVEFERMKDAAPLLAGRLSDADPGVRRAAYRALVFLGERGDSAVPVLTAHLGGDADEQTREAVLVVLGELGEAAEKAIPAIRNELSSESPAVRLEAATVLAGFGRVDDALPVMTTMLGHGDAIWRREAALAIGALGPAAADARSALDDAFSAEEDTMAKKAMEETLKKIGER